MNNANCGMMALMAGAFLLLGCGEDEKPTYTVDEFKAALSAEKCTALVRCGLYPSVDECAHHNFPFVMTRSFSDLALAIEMDRATYDAEAAYACASAVGVAECSRSSFIELPAICDEVIQGNAADGEDCYLDQECGEGLQCDGYGNPGCLAGTCRPATMPIAGQICSASEQCEEGSYCSANFENNSNTLYCKRYGQPGGACDSDDMFGPKRCAPGYGCVDNVCLPLPKSGEACQRLVGCESFTERCPEAGADQIVTCQPTKANGDACVRGECFRTSLCIDGMCQELGDLGDACDDQFNRCQYPLYCGRLGCTSFIIDTGETCEPLDS